MFHSNYFQFELKYFCWTDTWKSRLTMKININNLIYNVPNWSECVCKNLAIFTVSDYFGMLCIKRLKVPDSRACRIVGGCSTPPFPSPPPTFLKFVGVFTKWVGKSSWPNFVGKFGVFYHKKRNTVFFQYPVPQKSNFYQRWQLWKKLYKICTDD